MRPAHVSALLGLSLALGLPAQSVSPPLETALVAAVLPSSRSVQVGTTATVFATIINAGTQTGNGCTIDKPSDLPANFAFYRTDPATNAITSAANVAQQIAAGQAMSFLLTIEPTASFAPREVAFTFSCLNAEPAPVFASVNTLLLSASTTPVPDIIALTATASQDGIVTFDAPYGAASFALAAANVGASGEVIVSADPGATSGRHAPPNFVVCRTNPTTGFCLNGPTPPNAASQRITMAANETATFAVFGTGRGKIAFDPARNRTAVRFTGTGDSAQRGASSVAVRTLDGPIGATDFRDEVIYFALTDRFANGDTGNDNLSGNRTGDTRNTANPLGWHGGDFKGLEQKITEGYFSRLGFTALWITPVVLQVPPPGTGGGVNSSQPTTGYHGYWTQDFFQIEPHLGTLDDLKSLSATAKANGIKLVLDVVVNHAGYGSQLVTQNPSWFRTGSSCGSTDTTTCLAGLPDFITTDPEVRAYLFSTIQWLKDQVGIDAIRMDTMKHVDDAFWQAFFAPGAVGDPASLWTVGEIFDSNPARLAHFMDTLGSPSVFDFALKDAIISSIARGEGGGALAGVFAQDTAYSDPTKLSTFFDNHDIRRFVSESTSANFTRAQALERLDLALGVLYMVRGIPTVYYGTEIGMSGQGDPYNLPNGQHNRETMDFAQLASSTLDERIAALGAARKAYPALRRGAQRTIWPSAEGGCGVADTANNNAVAFGVPLFPRGTFSGWAASQVFVNLTGTLYAAELEINAGNQEYKIADAGWTTEYAVTGGPTQLNISQVLTRLGGGAPNATLSIAQSGCYRWEIDASNVSSPRLTITRKGDSSGLFAFSRTMAGQDSVLVLVNNTASPLVLSDLTGGGVPVTGLLNDGASLTEITGASATGFAVADGKLTGTIPARQMRAFVMQR
jgi:glycosidase